ncbi:MAG: hypothetical protein F2837_01255 [Actinobacteria bacterium]|uniref:Unannotated protein n=1 Tax=freshwater metagenome TaxID=449393 RepID=A0A6J7HZV9_9ZZZZ|nr:hypothetical protein [Actinomycetota bacterium]
MSMHHVRTLIVALTLCAGVLLSPVVASASTHYDPRFTQLDGIALGDSYSAGVGAGTPTGDCGRTDQSWAEKGFRSKDYMAGSMYLPGVFTQAACGGATISSVAATQLAAITKANDVATITVGGNDVGFASRVVACIVGTCPAKAMGIQPESGSWFELRAKLADLYIQIRSRMEQWGHLYVMTYPVFFGVDTQTCAGFTTEEQAAANAMATKLDDVIANAVADANRRLGGSFELVHLVDWRPNPALRIRNGYTVPVGAPGAGAKFDTFVDRDFGVCNTKGNVPTVSAATWHPTAQGYFRAAGRFFKALRFNQPPAIA